MLSYLELPFLTVARPPTPVKDDSFFLLLLASQTRSIILLLFKCCLTPRPSPHVVHLCECWEDISRGMGTQGGVGVPPLLALQTLHFKDWDVDCNDNDDGGCVGGFQ